MPREMVPTDRPPRNGRGRLLVRPRRRRIGRGPALHVDVGIVADQAGGPADLPHDVVAGVDAQGALDAAELDAVADVDAGQADIGALVAVDAVAASSPWRGRLAPSSPTCAARRSAEEAVPHLQQHADVLLARLQYTV
jgi:hypothetical protein